DGLAVADLEDLCQRLRFLRAAAGVPQDEVVAAPTRLGGDRLQHNREERVGDVADDQSEQRGAGATQPARERMRAIAQLLGGTLDTLAGSSGERHEVLTA